MAGPEHVKSLPSSDEIVKSLRDPAALVALGDSVVEHVMGNQSNYDSKWFERLWLAVGALRDAVEARTGINSAAVALALLLLRPEQVVRQLSKAEYDEIKEPDEEEVAAWAWGADMAKTTKWFVAFVVFGVLALLAFAVVTFGLESPGGTPTIIFLSVGSVILTGATLVLGAGLYRHYVLRGHLSWEYKGYPDAEVRRRKNFYQAGGWYAYTIGGFFLALSVAFAIIVGRRLLYSTVPDYTSMRLALLASMALGLFLFAVGVWPIVRNVVANAEVEKRMGNTKYMASPRLLLALLPIFTGTLSLLINWLFH